MNYKEQFTGDGFCILRQFFSEKDIDEVLNAIELVFQQRPLHITVDDMDTGERTVLGLVSDVQAERKRMKVNDLYLDVLEVRRIGLSERLTPILKDLLEQTPVLINSLYFEKGSAQPAHVDSLFMTPSTAGHLIAIWVALEDAHEDAGQLEYLIGSHRIEQMKFSNGSYHYVPEEMPIWRSYMNEAVAKAGLKKARFSAKKGDVLFWHAHLLHGGGAITDPKRTRKSLVFHYHSQHDTEFTGLLKPMNGAFWLNRPPAPVPASVSARLPFSEEAYLARYPDVAAAVIAGDWKSGRQHFEIFGQKEGRIPCLPGKMASGNDKLQISRGAMNYKEDAVREESRFNSFQNPLRGVPDVESPFFEEIFAAKEIDLETMRVARALHDRGYAIIDFPDPDFDARADRIKRQLTPNYDWQRWRKTGWASNDGLRIQDAWATNEDVKAIAGNPKILALLKTLYGRAAFPFQTLNFPVGTQQSIHSDSVHFSSVPERFMCGVWVAMEATDEDNGALVYVPESHKFPVYVNEHIGACSAEQPGETSHYGEFEKLWQLLIEKYGLKREVFAAKKGQALIWAANLLHGGGKQKDPSRTRWSQVTHYYFDNCVYYTPVRSDPMYGKIFYRSMVDVVTGEPRRNRYNDWEVPTSVIERSMQSQFSPQLPPSFDAAAYLRANPDVAAAGVDAARHYLAFGRREGRALK